jgi:hypothetical protein
LLGTPTAPSHPDLAVYGAGWITKVGWLGSSRTYGWTRFGESPSVTLSTYAHLFEELEGTERHSAEDEIRRAREAIRSSRTCFVPESETGPTTPEKKTPAKPEKPTLGLEPRTPSLRGKDE